MPRLRASSITVCRVMPFRIVSVVGVWSSPFDDQEQVRAGRFREPALVVVHQGVLVAGGERLVLRQRADDVQPGGLAAGRATIRGSAASTGSSRA